MKRIEDMTRLDLIAVALCIGGRSFSWSAKLREMFNDTKVESFTPETYATIMTELGRADAVALVECARVIEQELDKP